MFWLNIRDQDASAALWMTVILIVALPASSNVIGENRIIRPSSRIGQP